MQRRRAPERVPFSRSEQGGIRHAPPLQLPGDAGLSTGCEHAGIDAQLRKAAEEPAEAREAFEEFAKTGDRAGRVRLVEELMDIDRAVEQGERLLERCGASMEQARRDAYDRNRCRCRYAPGARLPR